MLSAIYTDSIGSISTCTTKFLFWSSKLENLIETIENDNARSKENVCLIFMILLMVMFNSMLNLVVTVAEEIHVFRREYNNHSFTVTTYFIAKNLSEFFFTVFSSAGFVWLVHRLTGQPFDDWYRLILFILPCCMVTLIGQFMGLIIGIVFYKDTILAIYSVIVIIVPIMLYSGLFKLIRNMSSAMSFLSYGSFLRSAMNSLMIIVYGYERCQRQRMHEEEIINSMNVSGEYQPPKYIPSLISIIEMQQQEAFNDSNLIKLNATASDEDKLILYLGLGEDIGFESRAATLQFVKLCSGIDCYWDEILQLTIHLIAFATIAFLIIFLKLKKRKKN